MGGKLLLAGLGGGCDLLLLVYLELSIPLGVLVLESLDFGILCLLGFGGGGGNIVSPGDIELVIEGVDRLLVLVGKLFDVFGP